jgi:peptidoglycan/LPS O-acetylase OafA/YrhL
LASVPGRPLPIAALTGVRFLAALHVVLYHYSGDLFASAAWPVRALIASGPSAVGLFYVLSGAVLTYSCTDERGQLTDTRGSFWAARFARIYPLYLLALIIDVPFFVSALMTAHDGTDVLLWGGIIGASVLLLLHAWTPVTVFVWNIPGWSISVEAFFYALFPSLLARMRGTGTKTLVARSVLFYGLALIPPVIVLAVGFSNAANRAIPMPPAGAGLDLSAWVTRVCGFSPIARLPEFLIGICLGQWLRRRGSIAPTRGRAAFLEAAALTILAGAWLLLGSRIGGKVWLDSGVLAPAFVLLIAVLATGSGPLARFLSTRPLQTLGHASYAMYILQQPVLIWALKVPFVAALPIQVFVPLFVGLLIALSLASQRYVAEPARSWLRSRRASSTPLPMSEGVA